MYVCMYVVYIWKMVHHQGRPLIVAQEFVSAVMCVYMYVCMYVCMCVCVCVYGVHHQGRPKIVPEEFVSAVLF
jgi:hypothetical protein